MVTWMALIACTSRGPKPNTIDGLQVVAITSNPANPDPLDAARLDVWVADGRGAGADVLVWSCAPVGGACLEAAPPGTNGLPLPLWTKVSTTTPDDPTATVTVGWPLFAGVAADAGFEAEGVLVWALACAPGLCPLVDQVSANPEVGSEAWAAAAEALAQPDQWIADLPPDRVSLAVKALPVRAAGTNDAPNRNPVLTVVDEPTPQVSVLTVADDDGDDVDVRTFVTGGGVDHQLVDSVLTVLWQPPMDPAVTQRRFVVAEDGVGGAAAWSDVPTSAGCTTQEVIGYRTEDRPLLPGGELPISDDDDGLPYLELDVVVAGSSDTASLTVTVIDDPVQTAIAELSAVAPLTPDGVCSGVAHLSVPMLPRGELTEWLCALGGRAVEVRAIAGTSDVFVSDVVLTLPEDLPCTQ